MTPALLHKTAQTGGWLVVFSLPTHKCAASVTFTEPDTSPHVIDVPRCAAGSGPYVRALAKLTKLGAYASGWSGPRSYGANPRSFELATRFLELLSDRVHANIVIEPTIFAEGTAVLEIARDNLKILLEFTPDGQIAANVDGPETEEDLDLEGFDGIRFPSELEAFFKN